MRGELWILNYEFWIVGRVRQVGQVGRGENFELWIGHKLQACASGGGENRINTIRTEYEKIANDPNKSQLEKAEARQRAKQEIVDYQNELRSNIGQRTTGSGCQRLS